MSKPYFSIVIPTRNRAETLLYAIQSCLNQDHDDYEIVVCDNCSTDNTQEVIAQFRSEKIRAVRTEKPLAMSDNWEYALSHVRGQYVTIIGDDDALMPQALQVLQRLLGQTKLQIVRWNWILYHWPNFPLAYLQNTMKIPCSDGVRFATSSEVVRRVRQQYRNYQELPMLYNSFVSRDVLDEIRRRTGRIFRGISPDVYSGFFCSFIVDRFLSVDQPLAFAGMSGKSNGASILWDNKQSDIAAEFARLNSLAGLDWSKNVPYAPKSCTAVIEESFAKAVEAWGGGCLPSIPEKKRLVRQIVQELRCQNIPQAEYIDTLAKIERWCSKDPGLAKWFEEIPKEQTNKGSKPLFKKKSLGRNELWLNCSEFEVTNILEAVELYGKLFGYSDPLESCSVTEDGPARRQQVLKEYNADELLSFISRNELVFGLVKRMAKSFSRFGRSGSWY